MKMDSSAERMIFEEELMPLIRERLAAGQSVRYLPFRGVSMLPMLRQGIDSVEISPLPEKWKKYDLPVYQYPSGKYVMHRIVDVKEDHFVCLGDNLIDKEIIYPDMILGRVSAFKRGDKRIDVENPIYQLYCRIWCASFPVRKLYRRGKSWLRRLLK